MLEKNQTAPEFNLQNQAGTPIQLSDFKGKQWVVLYFYPKDDTPGCTVEAKQFTELASEFDRLDTMVIGVSKDSCESHQNFIEKYSLNLQLIADVEGEVCEKYGVWQEKEKNGVKKMGIVRSTFLIKKDGSLDSVEYGVAAEGHAAAVLEQVKSANVV